MHLADLPKGEVEIEVSLNSNSHSQLVVDGVPVSASQVIQVD
jgi:hypothetical protein